MLAALLLIVVAVAATENTEQYSPECLVFNNEESSPSDGVPICYADATNKYSIPLINDDAFMDGITKINRERLPERLVHAKGTGAFGYFEVTHDISHICKADFLKKVGKKTPVVLRLSTGGRERGSSDLLQDSRGYSVRFYTEEGNFDILGFHTEMYFYKDPLRFSTIVHGVKRTPASNLLDLNTFWDAVTLIPDSLNFFVRIFSDRGIPASYRNMPGHSIHTYQIENDSGDYHFVRFHFIPDAGVKTLNVQDAMTLGATDPDYAIRDLYEAINKGEFPSWTVSAQILTKADVKKIGPRCFDVTRLIRTDEFPLHPIGKIVLNKNAENFQNDIEKLALCPSLKVQCCIVTYLYIHTSFETKQICLF
nr:peroxisomal catalase 1-like [Maniola hyperantus]